MNKHIEAFKQEAVRLAGFAFAGKAFVVGFLAINVFPLDMKKGRPTKC